MKKLDFARASYSQLHAATGIDPAVWSRWFNRKQSPTLSVLEEIAEKLDMPLLKLIKAFLERRDRAKSENEAD